MTTSGGAGTLLSYSGVDTYSVLGAPASLIGSELPWLQGSGLYNALGRAASPFPIAIGAAFTLSGCALREISGGATMTIPGGAGMVCTILQLAYVLGAPASIIKGRSSRATGLRPFALPRPDALSPLPASAVGCVRAHQHIIPIRG